MAVQQTKKQRKVWPFFDFFFNFYVSFYLLILIVCSTSLIILYRKPYDISARIFFIFLQLFALAQNFNVIYADNTFVIIGSIFFILSFNIFGVVLLHFHLLFPKPVSFFRKIRVYLYALYSTGILLGLIMIISFLRHFLIGTEASVMFNNTVIRWSTTWMAFTLLLALVFAFYQFIVEKNSNTKKQLQLVVIGSVFGLITPILYGISPGFIWRIEHEKQIMNMLELTSGIGTYIMTSFLAVAIFRYRIWNVEIVVRKAILYFSATAIIIFCYLLLLHLVNILMIDKTNVTQFIALAASVVVFLLLRDILQRYIDRLFYRESYNSTKMVKEFEEKYAGIYKLDELSKTATESLSDLFHCKSIIMALHKNHQIYSVAHYLGLEPEDIVKDFTITEEADFYLQNERIFSIEEISEKPKLFKYCQGELVIPMIRDGKPFGMIIMGAKLSERSYSLQDIELLSVLSKRIVSLFKTAELYERDLNRHLLLEEERIRIKVPFI